MKISLPSPRALAAPRRYTTLHFRVLGETVLLAVQFGRQIQFPYISTEHGYREATESTILRG